MFRSNNFLIIINFNTLNFRGQIGNNLKITDFTKVIQASRVYTVPNKTNLISSTKYNN